MSPITLSLDLLLVSLLITALYVGLKLNAKLKALRAGQAGFVKAVAELDVAAARAESGLKALRAASEDAHDELLTRIETARGLIARLDSVNDKAARLAEAVSAPAEPPKPPAMFRGQGRAELPRLRPAPPPPRPAARGLDDDLFEDEPLTLGAPPRRAGERL